MRQKISMRKISAESSENPFNRHSSLSSRINYNQNQKRTVMRPIHSRQSSSIKNSNYITNPSGENIKNESPHFEYQMLPKFIGQTKNSAEKRQYNCEQILYLLKNEKMCIQKMKMTVAEDNNKLNEHYGSFKKSIENMAEDLKLSISAKIHYQYQYFLDQFKKLKLDYTRYCEIKQEFWNKKNFRNKAKQNSAILTSLSSHSDEVGKKLCNDALVESLMGEVEFCKTHLKYEEFEKIQQSALKPIIEIARQLVSQINFDTYYKMHSSHDTFKSLYEEINEKFQNLYAKMDHFIHDHTSSQKQKRPMKEQGKIYQTNYQSKLPDNPHNSRYLSEKNIDLNHMRGYILENEKMCESQKQLKIQNQIEEELRRRQINEEIEEMEKIKNHFGWDHQFKETAAETYGSIKNQPHEPVYESEPSQSLMFQKSKHKKNSYSRNTFTNSQLFLSKIESIKDNNYNYGGVTETAICLSALPHINKIVVGTKTGTLKVFCLQTGIKLEELFEHTSGICSLTTIHDTSIVLSGGDIGCCRIVQWNFEQQDTSNFMNPFAQKHRAAVTCILDLEDGKHAMSGSFDSKVNIYNWKKKEFSGSYEVGEKITDLVLLKKNSRKKSCWQKNNPSVLIGHLANFISIWEIDKNAFNSFSGLTQVKKISIGSFPHHISLTNSGLFIGGKDKWVRKINIQNSSTEWAEQLPDFCLDLLDIGNKNLLCCLKNGDIYSLQCSQRKMRKIGMNSHLQYCSGINPKSLILNHTLYLTNHQNTRQTQIEVWNIQQN